MPCWNLYSFRVDANSTETKAKCPLVFLHVVVHLDRPQHWSDPFLGQVCPLCLLHKAWSYKQLSSLLTEVLFNETTGGSNVWTQTLVRTAIWFAVLEAECSRRAWHSWTRHWSSVLTSTTSSSPLRSERTLEDTSFIRDRPIVNHQLAFLQISIVCVHLWECVSYAG